jgi:hypothetical protein
MKRALWRTLLTEDDDDQVWCPVRIAFWIGFFLFLGLAVSSYIVKGQAFDPVGFGAGLGGLITGVGAGIFFNGRSEAPREKP